MTHKMPKTKRGADRQWHAIFSDMRRADGYQPFGYDWVTLRITRPETHAHLKAINAAYANLPD